jgi:hypothetical protein
MNISRIWESLTGRPHQQQNAGMVHRATNKLLKTADHFTDNVLKPYSESDDPINMLFEDIKRQREMARRSDK